MKEWIIYAAAVIFAGLCAYTDWRYHKIWNKYTFTAMGAGILMNGLFCGPIGLWNSCLGLAAGFALILLFVLGVLKAGDVKLYMAIGAMLGWRALLQVAAVSILIGGAAGVVLMLLRKNGRERFRRLWLYLQGLVLKRNWETYDAGDAGGYLCFGVCIAAGTALTAAARWLNLG